MPYKMLSDPDNITLEEALHKPYMYALFTPRVTPVDDRVALRNRVSEFLCHADTITRRGEAQLAALMSVLLTTCDQSNESTTSGEPDTVTASPASRLSYTEKKEQEMHDAAAAAAANTHASSTCASMESSNVQGLRAIAGDVPDRTTTTKTTVRFPWLKKMKSTVHKVLTIHRRPSSVKATMRTHASTADGSSSPFSCTNLPPVVTEEEITEYLEACSATELAALKRHVHMRNRKGHDDTFPESSKDGQEGHNSTSTCSNGLVACQTIASRSSALAHTPELTVPPRATTCSHASQAFSWNVCNEVSPRGSCREVECGNDAAADAHSPNQTRCKDSSHCLTRMSERAATRARQSAGAVPIHSRLDETVVYPPPYTVELECASYLMLSDAYTSAFHPSAPLSALSSSAERTLTSSDEREPFTTSLSNAKDKTERGNVFDNNAESRPDCCGVLTAPHAMLIDVPPLVQIMHTDTERASSNTVVGRDCACDTGTSRQDVPLLARSADTYSICSPCVDEGTLGKGASNDEDDHNQIAYTVCPCNTYDCASSHAASSVDGRSFGCCNDKENNARHYEVHASGGSINSDTNNTHHQYACNNGNSSYHHPARSSDVIASSTSSSSSDTEEDDDNTMVNFASGGGSFEEFSRRMLCRQNKRFRLTKKHRQHRPRPCEQGRMCPSVLLSNAAGADDARVGCSLLTDPSCPVGAASALDNTAKMSATDTAAAAAEDTSHVVESAMTVNDVALRSCARDILLANRVRELHMGQLQQRLQRETQKSSDATARAVMPVIQQLLILQAEAQETMRTFELYEQKQRREHTEELIQFLRTPRHRLMCASLACRAAFSITTTRVTCRRCGDIFCPKCCQERGVGPDVLCDTYSGHRKHTSLGWEPICDACWLVCANHQRRIIAERKRQRLCFYQDAAENELNAALIEILSDDHSLALGKQHTGSPARCAQRRVSSAGGRRCSEGDASSSSSFASISLSTQHPQQQTYNQEEKYDKEGMVMYSNDLLHKTVRDVVLRTGVDPEQRRLSDGLLPFYVKTKERDESADLLDTVKYFSAYTLGLWRLHWQGVGELTNKTYINASNFARGQRAVM